ncbi:MAG TPA: hemerythrin domain-containing protein [Vicinamibacteria bacterium]|nr:hemerythrin domain-containing protein [Vicinamibacteria bacterium]
MNDSSTVPPFDIRSSVGGASCALVLDAFDRLPPGDALEVSAGAEEARELLRRLQAERKGLFEWSLLRDGPGVSRFEVARRPAAPGSLREIGEALAWDHDRLDSLEALAFACLASGDTQGAREAWDTLATGLRRHIRFEEEILFPAFGEATGVAAERGPVAVMLEEHREIEALLTGISAALGGSGAGAPALRARLQEVLGTHNAKEEQVLYPMTDQNMDAGARDELVARIQRLW